MSLHNRENFLRFKELLRLIKCEPMDKKLLKNELKSNYYYNALKSISDIKRHLSEGNSFFSRENMRFFGTTKSLFSRKDFTVKVKNRDSSPIYELVWFDGDDGIALKLEGYE